MRALAVSLIVVVALAATAASEAQQSSRLSVVFFYDVTISTSARDLENDPHLKEVMESLPSNLHRADTFRLGAIARKWVITEPLAGDALQLVRRQVPQVADEHRFGPSPMWDAIYEAVSTLSHDLGRRAVIVVTDGNSTGNVHGISELIEHARANRVSVSAIGPGNDPRQDPKVRAQLPNANETLADIADATGGVCLVRLKGGDCRRSSAEGAVELPAKIALVFDYLRRTGGH